MEKLIAGAARLGVHLAPQQISRFELYYQELVAWNQRVNLTAIVAPEEVQTKHFLDSITVSLAFHGEPGPTFRVLDVGTGAGLPGLPLKVLYPAIQIVLLESVRKKVGFLLHVVQQMGIPDVQIVWGRAEVLAHHPQHREGYDAVLSRAVAPMATLVELTLPFCKVGGMLVAQKKGDFWGEIQRAATAMQAMGGRLREPRPVSLPELGDGRFLVIIDKVAPTPARYPRRAGVPRKRPLG